MTIRLPKELYERLRREAFEKRVSQASIVIGALEGRLEAEPEFLATQQRMRELAESLTWTCEGCGARLIGGQPPRCIGCRKTAKGASDGAQDQ